MQEALCPGFAVRSLRAQLLGIHSIPVLPGSPASVSQGGGSFFSGQHRCVLNPLKLLLHVFHLLSKKSSSGLPKGDRNVAFILQVSRAVLSFLVGNIMGPSGKMTHNSIILSSSYKNTAVGSKTQGQYLHLGNKVLVNLGTRTPPPQKKKSSLWKNGSVHQCCAWPLGLCKM